MNIPNDGWGAVEFLISKQQSNLEELNVAVGILNSWFHRDWIRAYPKRPRIVLCHYDIFAKRCYYYKFFFPSIPVYVVSHFGYSSFPEKFGEGFVRQLKWTSKMDHIIALSEATRNTWKCLGVKTPMSVIGNGADVDDYLKTIADRDVICLGKIEPRKRQVEIASYVLNRISIDFVGPICDTQIDQIDKSLRVNFLGSWNRSEVNSNLSRYKVLLLLSDGEADALVLYEAQAAGCSIVVSPEALGHQDPSLPWIYIVNDFSDLVSSLKIAINENHRYRHKIIKHAAENYSWRNNTENLLSLFRLNSGI